MKAFVVDKYKKQGALRLADVPAPELRDDDVMVRAHATAVNLLDSKVRDGEFKLFLPYRPPFILGHDVAGIVTRVGPNVRRFKAGDSTSGVRRATPASATAASRTEARVTRAGYVDVRGTGRR